ncbi:MAG: complex I NDUFA9 subunit family protein, partial [Bacteroidota bacterium]
MRVFVTGATGFIGSYILKELRRLGHDVRCLLRDPDAPLSIGGEGVERIGGNIRDPSSLNGAMNGCDAVIHLVGILEEKPSRGVTFEAIHDHGTRNVVGEAARSGIEVFVHMSANGASAHDRSGYQRTKWAAEQHVRNAGFRKWTIFRPALVFGDPGPENVEFASRILKQLVRPFPVLPVFGDGNYELQPVSVDDVAAAFVQALSNDRAAGKTYCAGGPERITYRELLDIIARGAGLRPKPKLPQPLWLVRPVVRLGDST